MDLLNPFKIITDAYNAASEEHRKRIRVIGVMGLTGTGKSTFIRELTNDHSIVVGDDLHSQTVEVSLSKMDFFASNNQFYELYLADTPGFDDTASSDTDVLRNIVTWLGAMREKRIKLSGIIYLHRITDVRLGGTALRNLRMLHNLVGADKMANVLLVSTRWEEGHHLQPLAERNSWWDRMEMRQNQLEQGFWQIYLQNGARVMRHDGSIASATRIVDHIIVCSTPIYIQIQDEVYAGKDLSQTAAGYAVKTDLERHAENMVAELANVKAELEALRNTQDDTAQLRLQYEEDIWEMEKKLRSKCKEKANLLKADNEKLKAEIAELSKKRCWQRKKGKKKY